MFATRPGTAVTGTDDVDHVEVAFADQAVPVDVEKVEAGGGAPVAEQARLDVVERQRAFEQRIVFEVDLADGKVVSGAPVGVHLVRAGRSSEGLRFCFGPVRFGRRVVGHGEHLGREGCVTLQASSRC